MFKKNKNFLGINKFKRLVKLTKKRIVCLGGINAKNKKLILDLLKILQGKIVFHDDVLKYLKNLLRDQRYIIHYIIITMKEFHMIKLIFCLNTQNT